MNWQTMTYLAICGAATTYEVWFIAQMVKADGSFMDRFEVPWERTKTMLGADKINAWLDARHQRRLVELQQLQAQIDALKGKS